MRLVRTASSESLGSASPRSPAMVRNASTESLGSARPVLMRTRSTESLGSARSLRCFPPALRPGVPLRSKSPTQSRGFSFGSWTPPCPQSVSQPAARTAVTRAASSSDGQPATVLCGQSQPSLLLALRSISSVAPPVVRLAATPHSRTRPVAAEFRRHSPLSTPQSSLSIPSFGTALDPLGSMAQRAFARTTSEAVLRMRSVGREVSPPPSSAPTLAPHGLPGEPSEPTLAPLRSPGRDTPAVDWWLTGATEGPL